MGSFYDDFRADPAKVAEADSWLDGTFSGEHYSAVEVALADLAEVPVDRLIGSDALARVLRLAKVHGDARAEKLREMAEAAEDEFRAQCEEGRSEARARAREAA